MNRKKISMCRFFFHSSLAFAAEDHQQKDDRIEVKEKKLPGRFISFVRFFLAFLFLLNIHIILIIDGVALHT